MKRYENKSNRNRSLVVLLVLCTMFVFVVAGCNEATKENTVDAVSEVESELVSEEVTEDASKEESEEVVSEEVSEEEGNEVEYVNFLSYSGLSTYLTELNQTTIVDYNFSEGAEQAIIPNGGKYTLQGDDDNFSIISTSSNINEVKANVDYISVMEDPFGDNEWVIFIETVGIDLEVSFTVVYEDGTEEDFIIYVTREG